MSIASAITAAQGRVAAAYTSCNTMGATMPAPSDQDLSHLPATIESIPAGGGGHTGTVDTAGLTALGWDADDIQWLQDHVWWDAADDAYWAVTEENKAFGPGGTTPITWSNKSTYQYNPDLRYFPKLSVTSSTTSWNALFSNYVHLVAIPSHGWDTSAIANFTNAFSNCYNLRSLGDTSYFVTSACTTLNNAFSYSINLNLDISHWDTSNVTVMSNVFYGLKSMRTLDFSGWSFTKVTTMSRFLQESNVESVVFPSTINAPVLTDLSYVFYNCPFLKSLALNFNAPNVTTLQSFAAGSLSIETVSLSINSTAITNLQASFFQERSLKTIDLSTLDTTLVNQTNIGANANSSIIGTTTTATIIKMGSGFFKGTFTTLYATGSPSWTRDSIYESLYTNQTTRDSTSPSVTVRLATQAYDRLSAQDISDIATKNITLTRG